MKFRSLALVLILLSIVGCQQLAEPEQEVLVVKIPPFIDADLTAGENQCRFSIWRQPSPNKRLDIVEVCKGSSLPNDGVPLSIELHEDRTLSINSEPNGTITDPNPMIDRLSNLFEERRVRCVVDETGNTEKSVGIRMPVSATYADLIKVVRASKESGADPIMLLLDGHLPEQLAASNP